MQRQFGPVRRALAWGAHLFTASGAVFGLLSLIAIEERDLRAALIWMGVAYLIDTVDGTLARWAEVSKVTPRFEGFAVDSVIDYFTHCILPAYFLLRSDLLPAQVGLLTAALVLVVTTYHFGNLDVKTPDYWFQGFPGWWNMVVFYLYLLDLGLWTNFAIVFAFCVLIFVPIKYVYPSRVREHRQLILTLSVVWMACNAVILVQLPSASPWLVGVSLACALVLLGLGLLRTLRGEAAPVAAPAS